MLLLVPRALLWVSSSHAAPAAPASCCSLGVNLGEAVNFAAPDWLRFGAAAVGRLRHFRKPCVVSQEEMLLRVAAQQAGARLAATHAALGPPGGTPPASPPLSPGSPSPIVCFYLRQELRRVAEEEWVLRAHLWSQGAWQRGGRRGGSTCVTRLRLLGCLVADTKQ